MRYTIWYEGYIFYGDSDGYNEINTDSWDTCNELIVAYGDKIHVRDNEYGVTFDYGDWN